MPVLSEWGRAGIDALRHHVAVFVIVDILSFSTAVDIAVSRNATIYPFPHGDEPAARATAERLGAVLALPRQAAGGQFSLSPASLLKIPPGTRLLLPSPNGSRLSLACGEIPVLAGGLRNAAVIAGAARHIAGDGAIGVIPAGELWPDGSLRPAIEDLLGAGAIIHHLGCPCSPEAQIARDAFRSAGDDMAQMIRHSVSGRELIDRGFPDDVELAVCRDVSGCVPLMVEGAYQGRAR